MRLRIDLAYDGASFVGFARQPGQRTVQGTLEGALSLVFGAAGSGEDGHPDTTCAGRTDRGVHALSQVVHVDLDPARARRPRVLDDLDALANRLDGMAGDDVTVWSVTRVDEDFDARFSASWRRYRYRLAPEPADPRRRALAWTVPDVDVPAMAAEVGALVGEHDFASFCRRAAGRTTVRRLLESDVAVAGHEVHVHLRGTAFCHQQVRAIVGSLVEVGRHRRPPGFLAEVLAARDRSVAGPVAPPHGLTLEAVGYRDPYPDADWGARPGARAGTASG